MKRGVITAICVSVLLIGSTLWLRFWKSAPVQNELVAVGNEPLSDEYYNEILSKFLEPTDNTAAESAAALTTTDLIGRQMLMEYMALAQSGQATEGNLAAITEKYVESIPSIISYTPLLATNLKTVSNNIDNLRIYATEVEYAYSKYENFLKMAPQGALGLDSRTRSLTEELGSIYADLSTKLRAMSVPALVAEYHLGLINLYAENASSMEALGQESSDTARSFAGLVVLKRNAQTETDLMAQIRRKLEQNGI